ncbi:MAG: hypothetical protein ACOYYS_27250 [Chloroflexota bacterium]
MEVNPKKPISITLLFLVVIATFLVGCSLQESSSEPTVLPDSSALAPQVETDISTPKPSPILPEQTSSFAFETGTEILETTISDNACMWPPKRILENTDVWLFSWSDDGKSLFYTAESGVDNAQWFLYDLEKNQSSPSDIKPVLYPELFYVEWADKFNIKNYMDILLSPDEQIALYTIPDSNSYQVYYFRTNGTTPILLGNIQGRPHKSFWFESNEKLLISIDYQAAQKLPKDVHKYYAYLIDIPKATILPLLPITDYLDVEVIGVNEEHVLFVSFSGFDRSVWLYDIKTGEAKQTQAQIPVAFQWLENRHQFIAVGYLNDQPGTLYLFDLVTNKTTQLLEHSLTDVVKISPDLRHIAFQGNARELYLLDCRISMRGRE